MGIENFLNRVCTQTAVYWGGPTPNGTGGFTFDDPVEISCRWEDRMEIVRMPQGREESSNVTVYVLQDLDEEGYLYLGELDDLDSNPDDPMEIENAFQIMQFHKIPTVRRTDDHIRKAFLYTKWRQV